MGDKKGEGRGDGPNKKENFMEFSSSSSMI
jgi:hypothetical protein